MLVFPGFARLLDKTHLVCESFIKLDSQTWNLIHTRVRFDLFRSDWKTGWDFSSYLKNRSTTTCFFTPTNEDEIAKIISKLGNRKSAGHHNVKSNLIKQVAHEISYPLSIVFNKSLSQRIVPDDFKIAKVVPIYKKDNPEIFGNYRPVSVLPCLSKILERLVYNRTIWFFI